MASLVIYPPDQIGSDNVRNATTKALFVLDVEISGHRLGMAFHPSNLSRFTGPGQPSPKIKSRQLFADG
jgi:hypothetical protein